MKNTFDVLIIGGGPAGLTGALTLARGGRSVLVMDDGKPRNAPASHMMNFPSRDGTPPLEFRNQIKEDLKKYKTVEIRSERVQSLARKDKGFLVNSNIFARKILLAHGVRDIMPPIPGFQELWGKAIFHCPYCHGHEHRDEKLGLIANEQVALHMAPLLKGLSKDLVLFTNGEPLSEKEMFECRGVKVYTSKIRQLIRNGLELKAVELDSGEVVERSYLFNRPAQEVSMTLGTSMGCELDEYGLYKTDVNGMTTQEGIYAAGDIAELKQSVLLACASGTATAAAMNFAILHEDF